MNGLEKATLLAKQRDKPVDPAKATRAANMLLTVRQPEHALKVIDAIPNEQKTIQSHLFEALAHLSLANSGVEQSTNIFASRRAAQQIIDSVYDENNQATKTLNPTEALAESIAWLILGRASNSQAFLRRLVNLKGEQWLTTDLPDLANVDVNNVPWNVKREAYMLLKALYKVKHRPLNFLPVLWSDEHKMIEIKSRREILEEADKNSWFDLQPIQISHFDEVNWNELVGGQKGFTKLHDLVLPNMNRVNNFNFEKMLDSQSQLIQNKGYLFFCINEGFRVNINRFNVELQDLIMKLRSRGYIAVEAKIIQNTDLLNQPFCAVRVQKATQQPGYSPIAPPVQPITTTLQSNSPLQPLSASSLYSPNSPQIGVNVPTSFEEWQRHHQIDTRYFNKGDLHGNGNADEYLVFKFARLWTKECVEICRDWSEIDLDKYCTNTRERHKVSCA
jgi:hypothetical protein